jgi:uncharacterized protein Usg
MLLIKGTVTVNIYYFRPDYKTLLQEFSWQTGDMIPEFPRVKKFLSFWDEYIEADIHEIYLMHCYQSDWRKIDYDKFLC